MGKNTTYAIHMTRLATAIATTKYSVEAVERVARQELLDLDIDDPTDIFFHCFRMPDVKDYEFICRPDNDGAIVVDTVTYEQGDKLTKGQFAGKRLMTPRPDSED